MGRIIFFLLAALSARAQTKALLYTDIDPIGTALVQPKRNTLVPANTLIIPDGLGPWHVRIDTEPFEVGTTYPTKLISKDTAFTFKGILPYTLQSVDNEEFEVTIKKKTVVVADTFWIDDSDASIMYPTNWMQHTFNANLLWYNKTISYDNRLNQTITYTFNGTGIAVYAERKASTHGDAGFTVDQEPEVIRDMGGSSAGLDIVTGDPIFVWTGPAGQHTIKIRVAESGRYIVFDAFKVWR